MLKATVQARLNHVYTIAAIITKVALVGDDEQRGLQLKRQTVRKRKLKEDAYDA